MRNTMLSGNKRNIDLCIAEGINFIDTSDGYAKGASEEILGEAIKGKRENLIIASKVSKKIKRFHKSINLKFKNIENFKSLKNKIKNKKVRIEYLEIRNKLNLSKKINKKTFKIFIAYYIDKVRLIDNF